MIRGFKVITAMFSAKNSCYDRSCFKRLSSAKMRMAADSWREPWPRARCPEADEAVHIVPKAS